MNTNPVLPGNPWYNPKSDSSYVYTYLANKIDSDSEMWLICGPCDKKCMHDLVAAVAVATG